MKQKETMKSNHVRSLILPLAMIGLAATSGCIVNPDGTVRLEPVVFTPAPVVVTPSPEIEAAPPVVEVPDTYIWDGTEYVGVIGDRYYYLNPGGVWLVADPVRFHRFHEWERIHPDWHSHAVRNDRFRRDAHGHVQPRRADAHGKQKATPKKKTEQH